MSPLFIFYFSSFKFSSATLTDSITKAEKVQFLHFIASSTCSITSFGKRMHLFVVSGIDGILNSFIQSPLRASLVWLFAVGKSCEIVHTRFQSKRNPLALFKGEISFAVLDFGIVTLVYSCQKLHLYLCVSLFFS